MNPHLTDDVLVHRGYVDTCSVVRAAAIALCHRTNVEWPRKKAAQDDMLYRLHYAFQGQCIECGCWWQQVVMNYPTDMNNVVGCPYHHGKGRWACFAFTFAPPTFESGVEGENVPPTRNEPTELDPASAMRRQMELERQQLLEHRRKVLEKYPNLLDGDEKKEVKEAEKSDAAERALVKVLDSMKDVPLAQMPLKLREAIKKLRGDDPKEEENEEARGYGRAVDDE